MSTLEKWLMATLALVALYLVVKSPNTGQVIGKLAGGYGDILKTLQGR